MDGVGLRTVTASISDRIVIAGVSLCSCHKVPKQSRRQREGLRFRPRIWSGAHVYRAPDGRLRFPSARTGNHHRNCNEMTADIPPKRSIVES